jgi:hypothetical protein
MNDTKIYYNFKAHFTIEAYLVKKNRPHDTDSSYHGYPEASSPPEEINCLEVVTLVEPPHKRRSHLAMLDPSFLPCFHFDSP